MHLIWSLVAPKSWAPLNTFDRAIARDNPQIGLARKFKRHFTDAMFQAFGIAGLTFTYFRTLRWGIRLMFQPIERASHPPISADHILHPRPVEKSKERKVVAEMVSR